MIGVTGPSTQTSPDGVVFLLSPYPCVNSLSCTEPTFTSTFETRVWSVCLVMTRAGNSHSALLPAHPLDQKLDLTFLTPLCSLGIVSLESLSQTRNGHAYMLPSSCLDVFGSARKLRDIRHAKVSLNRLTLLLSGTCYQLAMNEAH